jgi:cation:H+ antiporter
MRVAAVPATRSGVNGLLSRIDGAILLAGFVLAVLYLRRLGRRGLDIKPSGEVGHRLQKGRIPGRWLSFALFLLSLAAIVVGSEMLVSGAQTLLRRFQLSDLPFGMTILIALNGITIRRETGLGIFL